MRLWLADGAPLYSCTCPVAADGLFCKHRVAVGRVAFEPGGARAGPHLRPAAADVRAHLEGMDKARLVDLLLVVASPATGERGMRKGPGGRPSAGPRGPYLTRSSGGSV